jgi:acylphosphatase
VGDRDPDGNVEVVVEGGDEAMHVSSDLSDRLYVGAP